jgi:hypothetical protein
LGEFIDQGDFPANNFTGFDPGQIVIPSTLDNGPLYGEVNPFVVPETYSINPALIDNGINGALISPLPISEQPIIAQPLTDFSVPYVPDFDIADYSDVNTGIPQANLDFASGNMFTHNEIPVLNPLAEPPSTQDFMPDYGIQDSLPPIDLDRALVAGSSGFDEFNLDAGEVPDFGDEVIDQPGILQIRNNLADNNIGIPGRVAIRTVTLEEVGSDDGIEEAGGDVEDIRYKSKLDALGKAQAMKEESGPFSTAAALNRALQLMGRSSLSEERIKDVLNNPLNVFQNEADVMVALAKSAGLDAQRLPPVKNNPYNTTSTIARAMDAHGGGSVIIYRSEESGQWKIFGPATPSENFEESRTTYKNIPGTNINYPKANELRDAVEIAVPGSFRRPLSYYTGESFRANELATPEEFKRIERSGALACAPHAINDVMDALGAEPLTAAEIAQFKDRGFGQVARGALSIIHPDASRITWQPELVNLLKSRGLEVNDVSGSGAELVENIRTASQEGKEVIIQWEISPLVYHTERYRPEVDKNVNNAGNKLNAYPYRNDWVSHRNMPIVRAISINKPGK